LGHYPRNKTTASPPPASHPYSGFTSRAAEEAAENKVREKVATEELKRKADWANYQRSLNELLQEELLNKLKNPFGP